jgi:hypothetical protein
LKRDIEAGHRRRIRTADVQDIADFKAQVIQLGDKTGKAVTEFEAFQNTDCDDSESRLAKSRGGPAHDAQPSARGVDFQPERALPAAHASLGKRACGEADFRMRGDSRGRQFPNQAVVHVEQSFAYGRPVISFFDQSARLGGNPIAKRGIEQQSRHAAGEPFRRVRDQNVPVVFDFETFASDRGGDHRPAQSHRFKDFQSGSSSSP